MLHSTFSNSSLHHFTPFADLLGALVMFLSLRSQANSWLFR